MLLVTACLASPVVSAAEPGQAQGRIDRVQLLRVSEHGGEDILLLSLRDGRSFRLPGQRRLAAGPGVEVSLRYLPAGEAGEIPVACRIRVTAVPIERDGRTRLKRADRPFVVYRNSRSEHDC
ncbi:MAG: hypothetical protein GVY32_04955 [Gammaproteobacteria bacterium]|jgi:hypothetical protein|nr:hypothetical protein [Gammaproteobacteria bacterium]